MSQDTRRVQFNTLERALSDDLRTTVALANKLAIEASIGMIGVAALGDGTDRCGVLAGLTLSATGTNKKVFVSPGKAILIDATVDATAYDSRCRWIEVLESIEIDLAAYIDGADPRWVTIDIAPGTAVETTAVRDIWVADLKAWKGQLVDKVIKCSPVVTVDDSAVPDPAPTFTTGNAGKIPLAYIYLPAGAATISNDNILLCRPILNADCAAGETQLSGCGIQVAADGDTEVGLAGYTRFKPPLCGFTVTADFSTAAFLDLNTAGDPNYVSGDSWPPALDTRPIYFYLGTCPYPQGYPTNLAVREMRALTPSYMVGKIPSFLEGVVNGILIASETAPVPTTADIGLELSAALDGVNDATFGILGANAFQQMRVAYVGAASYVAGYGGFAQQRVQDGKRIRFGSAVATEASAKGAGTSSANQLGSFRNTLPLTIAGTQVLPDTAHAIDILWEMSVAASNTQTLTLQTEEPGGANTYVFHENTTVNARTTRLQFQVYTYAGNFRWTNNNTAGSQTSTIRVYVYGYVDAMLSRR